MSSDSRLLTSGKLFLPTKLAVEPNKIFNHDFPSNLLPAFAGIMSMMTVLWLVSVKIRNVSIVDLFRGFGFVVDSAEYFSALED